MYMLPNSVFKNVLHIGPNYKAYKGGTGAVLAIYQKNIPHFNFIPSYEGNLSTLANVPFFFTTIVKLLWLLLTETKIKIVHIHGHSDGSFYRKYLIFLLSKYLFKKKVIFHLHGADFHQFYFKSNSLIKKAISHLFYKTDCVIVLSNWWLNFVNNNFKSKFCLILDNPIELPKTQINKLLEENEKVSLLFMGRIGQRKGIFDLVDILTFKHEFYKNKLLLKVGGDGDVEKLVNCINKNKLHDIVQYIGWIDAELKHNALSFCDALVLPSYNEGLPIAILEAMSYGKAIISTNVGGIPEIVHNGENGFLINPGDNKALEDKINYLITHKTHLLKMGNRSLEIIHRYDINEVLKSMESLYKMLLQ